MARFQQQVIFTKDKAAARVGQPIDLITSDKGYLSEVSHRGHINEKYGTVSPI